MLMQYLSMSKTLKLKDLHSYPEYGAFICGNQIQLDVSKENFISVINVFNQIEAAKAYLLPILNFQILHGIQKLREIFLGTIYAWNLARKCRCQSKRFPKRR